LKNQTGRAVEAAMGGNGTPSQRSTEGEEARIPGRSTEGEEARIPGRSTEGEEARTRGRRRLASRKITRHQHRGSRPEGLPVADEMYKRFQGRYPALVA
jgi:hypothetical protein